MTTTMNYEHLRLSGFVGDIDVFRAETWAVMPAQYNVEGLSGLVTSASIVDNLDCGLLVSPFVRLFPETPQAGIIRVVVNNDLDGYLDPEDTRAAMNQGGSLICEQIELWHDDIAGLVTGVQAELSFPLTASALVLPHTAESVCLRTALAADDNEHLFLAATEGQVALSAGQTLTGNAFAGAFEAMGGPEGFYYLPPGCPATVSGVEDSTATILVLRTKEPSAEQLAELTLALFLSGPAEAIAGQHHTMSMSEKISWLRENLPEYLGTISARSLLDVASSEASR